MNTSEMKFIQFDKEKCDSCYKCLRVCPTNAIGFNGETREILDDVCIKCGVCQKECPQQALTITNPIDRVQAMIENPLIQTVVSIAPSYISAFELKSAENMAGALKALGFDNVEETSFGADIVAQHYTDLIQESGLDNVITSCCPATNYLIESHYPELIPYVLPVVSPMIAHGRHIKKRYGQDCFTVFIGPCLAKMAEAEELPGAIDAVITFTELQNWFTRENMNINEQEPVSFDQYGTVLGKGFPLGTNPNEPLKKEIYRYLHVSGIEECKNVLEELNDHAIDGYCLEINICDGSCVNGPEMPQNNRRQFQRKMVLHDYIENERLSEESVDISKDDIDVVRSFESRKVEVVEPTDEELLRIMKEMGKYSDNDELNCGACGYATCKEKARAVFLGRSDAENCLAYLRHKAESRHSNMIENSPNALCTVDGRLRITETNPTFEAIFNPNHLKLIDMPIHTCLDETMFAEVLSSQKSIKDRKIYLDHVDKHFIVNIIYHDKEHMALAFFTDITNSEKKKEEFEQVKKETLEKTQDVINKQMRVAQEIASLLGETTAETKMSLKSLKDLVMKG